MTGWRIGFYAGPRWLLSAMEKIQGQQTSGASTLSWHATLAALTGPCDVLDACRQAFLARHDLMVSMINRATGLQRETPQGAFYAFTDCGASVAGQFLATDEDVATELLDDKGVSVVHGSAFGLEPYIRIAYAIDMDFWKKPAS